VDKQRGKTYEGVNKPSFSPDSKHVAHVAWRAGKVFAVTDGVEGEAFDDVNDNFQFSPDGKRMVYLAKRGGQQFLVLDGVATAYDGILGFKFSPDSKRLFVEARRGNTLLMILEGEPPKKYELGPGAQVEPFDDEDAPIAFSPDGKRTAWVSPRNGKSLVVTGEEEGKPYDEIKNLQFTSDGKQVVYAAKRDGKVMAVVDGAESNPYDDFVSGPSLVMDGARTIRMLVTRGQETLRVEIEIAE